MPCDNIPDVPNGKRNPPEGSVTCGANVTYTCNEGFKLEGDSVLLCGTGGQLQGKIPNGREPGYLLMHFLSGVGSLTVRRFKFSESLREI